MLYRLPSGLQWWQCESDEGLQGFFCGYGFTPRSAYIHWRKLMHLSKPVLQRP